MHGLQQIMLWELLAVIQTTPLGLLNLVGLLFRFCVVHHTKESTLLQQNSLGSYCFHLLQAGDTCYR